MCRGNMRSPGRTGIVQLHQDDDFDYTICNICAEDIGQVMGMATQEKAEELRQSNRRLGGEVRRLKNRIGGLSETVTAFLGHDEAESA